MTTTVEKGTATTDTAVASKKKSRKFSPWGVVAWLVGLGFFFPVFWMVLTAFKSEGDAATSPPKLFFTPTLDQFKAVFEQGIGPAMLNSIFATGISTIRCRRSPVSARASTFSVKTLAVGLTSTTATPRALVRTV